MPEVKTAILTGGSGFLGRHFINGLSKNYDSIYVLDIKPLDEKVILEFSNLDIEYFNVNVSKENEVVNFFKSIKDRDILLTTLINAAANNPVVPSGGMEGSSKFEDFEARNFEQSVTGSLLGSSLMCREFVKYTSSKNLNYEKFILNIGSDLSVIAPDNRIYEKNKNNEDTFKPIEYSIFKHGILGLTKYLAVYLADKNYRVNTLSPTGIFNHQNEKFVKNFSNTVPSGRMLNPEEIVTHVAYLTSSDSQFLTGQNIIVDGGRSVW